MRILFLILMLWCTNTYGISFTDLKFSGAQVADTQWNVSSCTNAAGTSCQIISKAPGPTWNSGSPIYPNSSQYIAFTASNDATYPWHMYLYSTTGAQPIDLGIGRILSEGLANDGHSYFFFSNANYNGSLFSIDWGMNNTAGITITGINMPTVPQTDLFSVNGSTSPLAAGSTVPAPVVTPPVVTPPPAPVYKSLRPLMLGYLQSSTNTPGPVQDAFNALDGDINTKYLNFDKVNTGFTVRLSQGKVVSGLQLTTAEDWSGRDPASFVLYGSNDNLTWTTIDSQNLSLSNSRQTQSGIISITNTSAYVYYKIVFPTVKNPDTTCGFDCNSMQIAEVVFLYDDNNLTTSVDTGTTTFIPLPGTYCCGGSGSAFQVNPIHMSNILMFKGNATGSYVEINQNGNDNTVSVEQIGSKSNYTKYIGNGTSNDVTVNQTATNDTQTNYVDLSVNGNYNVVNIEQYTALTNSFGKGIFASVTDDNNTLTVNQLDGGSHYANVNLLGGNKHVDITQQGPASHMTDITLSGQPVDLSLRQSGATQQFYSINFNCATANGCAPIQVQQGQ